MHEYIYMNIYICLFRKINEQITSRCVDNNSMAPPSVNNTINHTITILPYSHRTQTTLPW